MARETKIGLLVGMGFIVCFAIILSHRGGMQEVVTGELDMDGIVTEVPRSIDDGAAARQASLRRQIAERPAEQNTRDSRQSRQSRQRHQSRPSRSVAAGPDRGRQFRPQPEQPPADVSNDDAYLADAERFTRRTAPIAAPPIITGPVNDSNGSDTARLASPGPTEISEEQARHALRPRMPRHQSDEWNTPEAVIAAVEAGPAPSPSRLPTDEVADYHEPVDTRQVAIAEPSASQLDDADTYTVQSGDNLTKIARRHYGADDRDVINAIFAANRATMSSPDHLVVGKDIRLPRLPGMTGTTRNETVSATPEVQLVRDLFETQKQKALQAEPTPIVPAGAEYTIVPGDSLSKIAAAHYGSSSRSIIRAICDANPKTIPSPDRIVVGRTIILPPSDAALASGGRAAGAPSNLPAVTDAARERTVARSEMPESDAIRWYELKKGDVYSTVAAEQLGTSKRWPELVELNRDIFPDPSNIRYGVKIRIPVDAGDVTSAGLRARSSG